MNNNLHIFDFFYLEIFNKLSTLYQKTIIVKSLKIFDQLKIVIENVLNYYGIKMYGYLTFSIKNIEFFKKNFNISFLCSILHKY